MSDNDASPQDKLKRLDGLADEKRDELRQLEAEREKLLAEHPNASGDLDAAIQQAESNHNWQLARRLKRQKRAQIFRGRNV